MKCRQLFLRALVLPWLGAAAFAEEAAEEEEPAAIEEIIVLGHPLSGEGLAQASDVLSGEELDRKVAGNIGATVGNQPGIHNASFGAALGRPVIHGLDGARVRIMEDRIDTLDVSVTSAEHAVTVDPFIANQGGDTQGVQHIAVRLGSDRRRGRCAHRSDTAQRAHGSQRQARPQRGG